MTQPPVLDAAAALSSFMDLKKGRLSACTTQHRRRLSDLCAVFSDEEARARKATEDDETVYESFLTEPADQPRTRALCYSTTVVYPGRVGDEYYMTRGHRHTRQDSPEVCLTVRGRGMVLLQTDDFRIQALALEPGIVVYVPGVTSHRIVNTGVELLAVFSVFPLMAGRNYRAVDSHGFRRIVVATPDGPDLVPNPRFRPGKGE